MSKRGQIFLMGILILGLFTVASLAWADAKEIVATIDEKSAPMREVSRKIHGFAEQRYEEYKSSQLLMEELQKLGFKVTGDLKISPDTTLNKSDPDAAVQGLFKALTEGVMKTAFRAELTGKGPGPTVTIMLEYDALPNGHSCGHNLIATSGLLAAAGLVSVMAETPGRILVLGTPAEESGPRGGKIFLLEGGHFEGSDVVFITHPSDRWNAGGQMLSSRVALFTFKGKASHAAAAPHKGINALNAVIHTFNGIDMLRGHLRQDVRIHGIITKGGEKRNIVTELAQCDFSIRALDVATLDDAYEKVVNCAKAGALATGATLEFRPPRTDLKSPIPVPSFTKMVLDQSRALGVPAADMKPSIDFGSGDPGNVGHAYPLVNFSFKIAPEGTAGHSDALREAALSNQGWEATVTAAKAIALTAYDLLTHPDKVKAIQEEFKKQKAMQGK